VSQSELLALQFSLVLPGAVKGHEVGWSGCQHPGWAGVRSSCIKITLQIITLVLSFKESSENDILTFPTLPPLQNVIAFFNSKPFGRVGEGIVDVHVTATGCAHQTPQDRRLNKQY